MTVIDFEEYRKRKHIEKVSNSIPDEFELDDGTIATPLVYTIMDDCVLFALKCVDTSSLMLLKCPHFDGKLFDEMHSMTEEEIDLFLETIENQDMDLLFNE